MKKTLCFISVVFAFALLSCTETVEDKIRKEFKIYVHQNFDDPESLKEILSITLSDTVSAKETAEELMCILAQCDSATTNLQDLRDSLLNVVIETCKRPRALSEFRRDRHLQGLMLKFADLVNEEIKYISSAEHMELKSDRKDLDESLSKLESDSIIFFTYKIRTRIENHGELSIKEYYARIYKNDSTVILDNNNYQFKATGQIIDFDGYLVIYKDYNLDELTFKKKAVPDQKDDEDIETQEEN